MYEKEDKEESKKKFFKFLQTAEQIDKEIQEKDKKPEFKPEIEVSFDSIQPREDAWEQPVVQRMEVEEDAAVVAHEPVSTESKLVSDAKRIFTPEYLMKNFAKSTPAKTQRALENFVRQLNNPEDVQMFLIALVSHAFEINEAIPNAEMLFYKMFQTPITTREEESENSQVKHDILDGRVFEFDKKLCPLSNQLYRSLLETAALHPKKKFYKRIIAYLVKVEEPKDVDSQVIDMIVDIGIQ